MTDHRARLAFAPPCDRFSLRVAPQAAAALGEALGLDLPARIGSAGQGAGATTLCLGPDEWMVIAEHGSPIAARSAAATGVLHSLVDISSRELAFELTGPDAARLLNAGCPADLDAMPAPSAARTVFDGVQIVLFKRDDLSFRVEVWRSFAPHVLAVLREAGCPPAASLE